MDSRSSFPRLGGAVVVLVAAVVVVLVVGQARSRGAVARRTRPAHSVAGDTGPQAERPIGIVDAFGPEQAAILNRMQVAGQRVIDGYRFYTGTIAGKPVVDVAGGEANETAELSTYLLDTTFHPRATLFEGTAGAQNDEVHVGDVVLSGFVVDKSEMHYYLGGYEEPYDGEQMNTTGASNIRGAVLDGHGQTNPTPSDARRYGEGPSTTAHNLPYVLAYAAPHELLSLGEHVSDAIGSTPLSIATGSAKAHGSVTNKVIAGVIGQADVWTEPLSWIRAQNMLYESDAEENEGSGFAFANSQLGVPWLLVRGISDSVWYPHAYDGVISSDHAAKVIRAIVAALPATVSRAPETIAELSPQANARRAGYLIADRAYFGVTPVSRVVIPHGASTETITGARLQALTREYTYAAGRITGG
jgi:adenosylhomocysteine nucleosidase